MARKKKPPRRTAGIDIDPANPPEMTVNEVAEVYPEQWVLMRVTDENEYHHPWRGHILAVSHDERHINQALSREPRPSQLSPDVAPPRYYVFQAYRHIYPGPELDAWLAQVRGHGNTDGPLAQD